MTDVTKQRGIARRVQRSYAADGTGVIAAYHTKLLTPKTLTPDVGAYTATLSGVAQPVQCILGPAISLGRTTGAVDLGVGNAQIDPTTDSHWVEVWARPLDVAMSDANVPIIGKGLAAAYSTYTHFGIQHTAAAMGLYWRNAAAGVLSVAGPAPKNKLTHFLYQVDRTTNNAYLYVDGVQYGPTAITTFLANAATNWIMGKNGSTEATFDEGFGGLTACPRIGTGVLTQAQVQARYLLGAKAVQFKTDWAYPISPADEGGVTGQQIGGLASPFRAGDAVGRWAIETDTIDGRTCKVLTCKTNGEVYIPASYFGMGTTPTEASFGTWEWWWYKGADANSMYTLIASDKTAFGAGINAYSVLYSSPEYLGLNRYVAGVAGTLGYSANGYMAASGTWYRMRVTKSLAGVISVYRDGVLYSTVGGGGSNPVTDTAVNTSLNWVFGIRAGDKIALGDTHGDHSLVKYLGVVTP